MVISWGRHVAKFLAKIVYIGHGKVGGGGLVVARYLWTGWVPFSVLVQGGHIILYWFSWLGLAYDGHVTGTGYTGYLVVWWVYCWVFSGWLGVQLRFNSYLIAFD